MISKLADARKGAHGLIGKSLRRLEDARLLRGAGKFVDDIHLPGMLHAAFLRSPVAHGLIHKLDLAEARALPGIAGVYSWADLRPRWQHDRMPLALHASGIKFDVDPFCLVKDEVCYVGECIAIVVADSRAIAEDAVALIDLVIDPLPAVTDPCDGLMPDAPRARLDTPDNLVALTRIKYGDIDGGFSRAAHVVKERYRLSKGGPHSIETRGLVARYDARDETLTVHSNTQMPHRAKQVLVAALGLGEHQVVVVNPDVGGGFGPKALFHPEELSVPTVAMLLGKPVKWIEDRYESFVSSAQERVQDWDMEGAFDANGRLLAIRGKLSHDHGSSTPYGIALPYNASSNLVGPYVLPAFHIEIALCLTNMVPATSTRGAGRPQGTFVMERLLDRMAKKLGIAREEIRSRNLIKPGQMPYSTPVVMRDGSHMTYDSGDYPECQKRALEAADWAGFATRREAARKNGKLLGIGLANYVEGTGRGPFESASIRVGASGKIMIASGATSQGQGTKTMLAQIAADVLGVAPADVHVVPGDTRATPMGLGAYASRQTVTAGNAIFAAANEVREKAIKTAAVMLEAAAHDLELKDGVVRVKGVPGHRKTLAEIAHAISGVPGFALPGDIAPGLASHVDFQINALAFCNGAHVCEAQVDPGTGHVKLTRYIVVHDCGTIINPMMVDGQVLGAVAHGIGATLFEWMRFDETGQPQTVTYADYLLPTAEVMPRVEIHHMESPSPLNPLGVKGAAESGTIAAPAVIISAVEDALRHLDLHIRDLPLTPPRLLALIKRAQKAGERP